MGKLFGLVSRLTLGVGLVSSTWALAPTPLVFNGQPQGSQQQLWDELLKYKLWGKDSLTFWGQNISVPEENGYSGTMGDFRINEINHRLDGPIVVGRDMYNNNGQDTFQLGYIRIGGNLTVAENAKNSTYFHGNVCVEGDYINPSNGVFNGAKISQKPCPSTYPPLETNLTIPTLDLSELTSEEATAFSSTVLSLNNQTHVIDGRPTDGTNLKDVYLKKLDLQNNAKLLIRQNASNNITRIFIDELVGGGAPWSIQVTTDGVTEIAHGDYAGTLLIYIRTGGFTVSAGEKVLHGTYIVNGDILIKQNIKLAGQLLGTSLKLDYGFETEGFRYVPFDPPLIDPDAFVVSNLRESTETDSVPQKINFVLTESAVIDASFKYWFVVPGTETPDSGAHRINVNDLKPGYPTAGNAVTVTIPKGSKEPSTPHSITIINDELVEGDETLELCIQVGAGVSLSNGTDEQCFDLIVTDDDIHAAPTVPDNFTFSVYENSAVGTLVDTVKASHEKNHALSYAIIEGDPQDVFTIDAKGRVLVNKTGYLDYEGPTKQYVLTVEVATEYGKKKQTQVTINVLDVNEAPQFVPGETIIVVNEDSGLQSIANWATGIFSGPGFNETMPTNAAVAQTVEFKVSEVTNSTLFKTQPAIAPDGTLTFESAKDAFGSSTVTIYLKDNGLTANDGVDRTTPVSFVINITAVNDDPEFEKDQYAFSVLENEAVGTKVGEVKATDVDDTDLTYSISGGTNKEHFAIDPTTGAITIKTALDYETQKVYELTVKVIDVEGGSASVPVTITVLDVNEAPQFVPGETIIVVNEDSGLQSIANWATGIFSGPGFNETMPTNAAVAQTVEFKVSEVTNSTLFKTQPAIAPDGTLTFESAKDAFGSSTVTIYLKDNGLTANDGIDRTKPVSFVINITAVNDDPEFEKDQYAFSVLENKAVGTKVGEVKATDVDDTDLTYSISGGTNKEHFAIDPTTGAITIKTALDYETQKVYELTVKVIDGEGGSASVPVTITVLDVNEAPQFVPGETIIVVNEDSGEYNKLWATGIYSGSNAITGVGVTEKWPTDDNKYQGVHFFVTATNTRTIAPSTNINVSETNLFESLPEIRIDTILDNQGNIESFTGYLVFTPAPNAYGESVVTVYLQDVCDDDLTKNPANMQSCGVSNGGVNKTTPITFKIIIENVNDTPTFDKDAYEFSIEENTEHGTLVGVVKASDIDSDELVYSIISGTNKEHFAIEPTTGKIVVAGDLDFETQGLYVLAVQADDGEDPDSVQVTINIIDVNEAPSIVVPDHSTPEKQEYNYVLFGTDPDAGDVLTYELLQKPEGMGIDPTTGKITWLPTAAEAGHSFDIVVKVTDRGGLSASSSFELTVDDLNDPPVVINPNDTTVHSIITTVWEIEAYDEDKNDILTYELSGPSIGIQGLSISGNKVSFKPVRAQEGRTDVPLQVKVSDGKGGVAYANWTISTIIPYNFAPEFNTVVLAVPENSPAGTVAGTITATDDEDDVMTFTLLGGDGKGVFTVDDVTGVVKVAPGAKLNYEVKKSYSLYVEVSDSASVVKGTTVEKTFIVNINDVNDAPVIVTKTLSVREDAKIGAKVGTVEATDEDGDILKYYILNPNSSFKIDSLTGMVTVKKGLDYESATTETITVRVFDGVLSDTAKVLITIENVIEKTDVTIISVTTDDSTYTNRDTIYTKAPDAEILWRIDTTNTLDIEPLVPGLNVIVVQHCSPDKDLCGADTVVVIFNPQVPKVTIVTDSSRVIPPKNTIVAGHSVYVKDTTTIPEHSPWALPELPGVELGDTVWFVNDSREFTVTITYLDENLQPKTEVRRIHPHLKQGLNAVSFTYTDKFGYEVTEQIWVYLETQKPVVKIVQPQDSVTVYNYVLTVQWTVNGNQIDTLDRQTLEEGWNEIVRHFMDRAGNIGSDTIYVKLVDDRKKVDISLVEPLVQLDNKTIAEFYAKNPLKKDEFFALSIFNNNSGLEEHAQYGIGSKAYPGTGMEPYPDFNGKHLGPTLRVTTKMPQMGGVDAAGTPRGGNLGSVIEPDGRIALDNGTGVDRRTVSLEEYLSNHCNSDAFAGLTGEDLLNSSLYTGEVVINVGIFDAIGQFVDRIRVVQQINNHAYISDAGQVTMFLEIKPSLEAGLRSQQGRAFGSGAYIIRGEVTSTAVLQCDTPNNPKGHKVRNSDNVLTSFGYMRSPR